MCFAVIVGKHASADGSVLLGHNEQNAGANLIHYRRVPRRNNAYSYLWVESPGLEFSDNCFNEWGVAIAGNGCPTKEGSLEEVAARGDIVDGGIGYLLPRLVAEQSKTARQGVDVAISLIERYGYTGSGRTLSIADGNEAWVLAIARGRHYVAQRVPDDAVVLIPNTHVIGSEAREGSDGVRTSRDIISHAEQRGWFDKSLGVDFSFAQTFAAPQASGMEREWGICSRQWQAQALVSGFRATLPHEVPLPFAVRPHKPLSVADVAGILRSHQEGTDYDLAANSAVGSPHEPETEIDASFARSVCNIATQESVIWQLRDNLPRELGNIAWRATGVPCVSVYTPWYLAVDDIPSVYHDGTSIERALDIEHHFNPNPAVFKPSPTSVYWTFQQLAQVVEEHYGQKALGVQAVWQQWEQEQFLWQEHIEQTAMSLMETDLTLGKRYLALYSVGRALAAWQKTQELLEDLKGTGVAK